MAAGKWTREMTAGILNAMTPKRGLRPALIILFLLISGVLALAAQSPAEAAGFAGGGLHLYPMGWSSEGRWGALIGRNGAGEADGIRLLIIDAVTDDILFRSRPMEWNGPQEFDSFWARYGRSVLEKTDSFHLESTRRPDVRDPAFITGGTEYTFEMTPPAPIREAYTLTISSSRGDRKTVYISGSGNVPDRTVLLGALVSPFEERALAIIRESPSYGEGEPEYRFSGAHLTLGFSRSGGGGDDSDGPVWTATRPSATGSLISAVFNGQEYLVRTRLAAGVDPDSRDGRGYTALLVAARLEHWQMVRDLVSAGASVNVRDDDGRTALHYAAFAGRRDTVAALLNAGADPGIRDKAGRLPSELTASTELKALLP